MASSRANPEMTYDFDENSEKQLVSVVLLKILNYVYGFLLFAASLIFGSNQLKLGRSSSQTYKSMCKHHRALEQCYICWT